MSYYPERIKVENYLEFGVKPSQIAIKLSVRKSTFARELSPCQKPYSAKYAQAHSDQSVRR